jgi:hypothetical protein
MIYSGTFQILGRYWRAYGGIRALVRSFYLFLTLLLLAATWHIWFKPQEGRLWWDLSIAILPNLLGFTLGGFAIFIGFGDARFREALAKKDPDQNKETIYVRLCATFVHFILVQVAALIYAVVAKSLWFYSPLMDSVRYWLDFANLLSGALGFGLFLYSLTLVLAATMHVFRIASMYQVQRNARPRGRRPRSR